MYYHAFLSILESVAQMAAIKLEIKLVLHLCLVFTSPLRTISYVATTLAAGTTKQFRSHASMSLIDILLSGAAIQ